MSDGSATPLSTLSFTAALWLLAKGYEPIAVTLNPTGTGVLCTFPAEARSVWQEYGRAKDRLTQLRKEAR